MYEELISRLLSLSKINAIQQEPEICRITMDCIGAIKEIAIDAADAIETMCEMVATAHDVIQIYEENKPRWISVTEQLPEIGTYIIAGRMKYDYENEYTHFVDVAYFGPLWNDADCSWQTFNDWCEGQQEFEITHWMPLPEPPKEET